MTAFGVIELAVENIQGLSVLLTIWLVSWTNTYYTCSELAILKFADLWVLRSSWFKIHNMMSTIFRSHLCSFLFLILRIPLLPMISLITSHLVGYLTRKAIDWRLLYWRNEKRRHYDSACISNSILHPHPDVFHLISFLSSLSFFLYNKMYLSYIHFFTDFIRLNFWKDGD